MTHLLAGKKGKLNFSDRMAYWLIGFLPYEKP
jgi:hypothetical protein